MEIINDEIIQAILKLKNRKMNDNNILFSCDDMEIRIYNYKEYINHKNKNAKYINNTYKLSQDVYAISYSW